MIKDYVLNNEVITYSGPFELKELHKLIKSYMDTYHYTFYEKNHFEKRDENGKYIEILFEPYKTVSDYVKMVIEIRFWLNNVKDISVDVNGKKRTYQQGDVKIQFKAIIYKDYMSTWEVNPFMMFLRSMIDKYIYRSHFSSFREELSDDVMSLKNQIKSFLNLYTRK